MPLFNNEFSCMQCWFDLPKGWKIFRLHVQILYALWGHVSVLLYNYIYHMEPFLDPHFDPKSAENIIKMSTLNYHELHLYELWYFPLLLLFIHITHSNILSICGLPFLCTWRILLIAALWSHWIHEYLFFPWTDSPIF